MPSVVGCALTAANAMAVALGEHIPLEALSRDDTARLVHSWGLPQLSQLFHTEHVDGETLAFAEEGDFPVEHYPGVRPHHWKRFWRRLVIAKDGLDPLELRVASEGAEDAFSHSAAAAATASFDSRASAAGDETRRNLEATSSGDAVDLTPSSGIRILSNESTIALGISSDVTLSRDNDGLLSVEAPAGVAVETLWLSGETVPTPSATQIAAVWTAMQLDQKLLEDFLDPTLYLWLQGGDLVYEAEWRDHRGLSYHAGTDGVACQNLELEGDGSVRFPGTDEAYCTISTIDIGPTTMPQLTISVWVKLNSYGNNYGWLVSHDDGGFDRSILMHDTRWGTDDDGNGFLGLGAGASGTSTLGLAPLNKWLHIVGTWDADAGVAVMYSNLDSQQYEEAGEGEGLSGLTLGTNPSYEDHFVDGWVMDMRVYGRSLTSSEVAALHLAYDPDLLLWLEVADYNPFFSSTWLDRRAYTVDKRSFTNVYDIVPHNVTKSTEGFLNFEPSDFSLVNVYGLDVSPSNYNDLSISVWFRLNSYDNDKGWIINSDDVNGGYDRAIILHDSRFGENEDGIGYTALGVGQTFESDAGVTPLHEFVHIVGVWSQGGSCHLYRNGVAYNDVVEDANNGDSEQFLKIGGFGKEMSDGHWSDVDFDSVRVYSRALDSLEVDALYAEETKQYLKML